MTQPTLYPESGLRRLRVDISYDGTNFYGWAIQPDRRTVQATVESAFNTVTQCTVDTIVAGRTDAGVHAIGQVIHLDLPESIPLDDLAYKLNRILDEDVRVMAISIAPPAFHARFSALRRAYSYRILDANRPIPPLLRLNTAPWYRPLDLDLMNEASALLLGQHNFAAFCKFREGATTIRTLETFNWVRDTDGFLIGDVIADAFCYSMVRNLVGAVVCVADGRFATSWISQLLANRERVSDSLVFPARGLTLYRVDYPTDAQLLERAEKTISRREAESN